MKLLNNLFLPVMGGLLFTQLIATGFVHLSNRKLHELVLAVEKSGYIALPYGKAADSLLSWQSAFFGGLFYTLSIGAGLTIFTWLSWLLWNLIFQKNRFLVFVFFILWACLLVAVNIKGLTLFPTLFCLLVPLGTLICCYKFSHPPTDFDRRNLLIPAATLCLLVIFWAGQFNQTLFTTIRDRILLSNPVGQTVNDFYYRYTLYAAQAFKSFNQKTVRTYRLSDEIDGRLAENIKRRLLRLDVLPIPELLQSGMTVTVSKTKITLTGEHGNQITGQLTDFLKNPKKLLNSFSKISDRYESLRKLSFYGLLLGFPILLFIIVYGFMHFVVEQLIVRRLQIPPGIKEIVIAVLTLCMGIGFYWPLWADDFASLSDDGVSAVLESNNRAARLAALQKIESERLELADYPQYRKLLQNALPVELYWLARAMTVSQSPETYDDLLSMIDDNHSNVRCQVYYALGMRGDKKAIGIIKAQLLASEHWYTQRYAYLALKRLGWQQGQ